MLSDSQQLRRLDRAATSTGPLDGDNRRDDPSFGLWRERDVSNDQDRSSPKAASSDNHLRVPRTIGRVKLLRQIGRGGMGVVWLGWHELLRTEVAVKFILASDRTSAIDLKECERFLIGARAAASIRHPGLTRVLHADIINSIPYVVMEFIPGRSIQHVLRRRGALDQATALSVLDAAAEIVAHLHEHEVVHGDIKPENLLLNQAGELFLTDFGLACRPGAAPCFVAGTPAYMAPEMFDGTVYPRSDVYALGIMAYELLAGRRPFGGTREELRICHSSLPIPRAPLLRRGVSEQVVAFIERVTNRNSFYRIKTAGQLLKCMRSELSKLYAQNQKRDRLFALLQKERGGTVPGVLGRMTTEAMRGSSAEPSGPDSPLVLRRQPVDARRNEGYDTLTRMACRKREARSRRTVAAPAARSLQGRPAWFLTRVSLSANEFCPCCAVCGQCGALKLMAAGEHRCDRCGAMMRLVFGESRRRGSDGQDACGGIAHSGRRMLSRWIDLLRMPLW